MDKGYADAAHKASALVRSTLPSWQSRRIAKHTSHERASTRSTRTLRTVD
jgi:hypothetical protein